MKKFSLTLGVCLLLFASCGNPARDKIEVETVEDLLTDTSDRYEIIGDSSVLYWKNYLSGNQGTGNSLRITQGEFRLDGGDVTGEFTIASTDSSTPEIKFILGQVQKVENNKFVTHEIGGALEVNGDKENVLFDVKTEKEDGRYYIHSVPFRVSSNQWSNDISSNTNDSIEIEFRVVAKRIG